MVALLKKEIQEVLFTKTSFANEDLKHKYFANCAFEHCDFSRADLSNSKFHDCTFKSCNFSLVKIEGTRWDNIEFTECRLLGIDFSKIASDQVSFICKRTVFDSCYLSNLDLHGGRFVECYFKNSQFVHCNLQGADFKGSNLQGTVFHDTDLRKADFRKAMNFLIDPLDNKVNGAIVSKQEAGQLNKYSGVIVEQ